MNTNKAKIDMKPTSKTPYEIRLELLQLAQSILNTQRSLPGSTAATTEEIVAEAEKMNAFVSKANLNH